MIDQTFQRWNDIIKTIDSVTTTSHHPPSKFEDENPMNWGLTKWVLKHFVQKHPNNIDGDTQVDTLIGVWIVGCCIHEF